MFSNKFNAIRDYLHADAFSKVSAIQNCELENQLKKWIKILNVIYCITWKKQDTIIIMDWYNWFDSNNIILFSVKFQLKIGHLISVSSNLIWWQR